MDTTNNSTKKCTSCRRSRDLGDFTTNWRHKDGLSPDCKDCRNQYTQIRRITRSLNSPKPKRSNGGRPLKDNIDPDVFLWNLRNHNQREFDRLRETRPFRYPKSPYRKMLYVQDVNTLDNFVVRLVFNTLERTSYTLKKPNDRLISGMIYLGPFDPRLESIILKELLERDLRII